MTQTNSQQKIAEATRDAGAMFAIKGTVSTMYITDGTVNLLKGMQGKMAATGMAAAIEGMAGAVANAAMISMYEGEDVQHFGCYIGEQMVIGTFENIGFKEGDEVQMVVTKLDDKVAYAHAVVRSKDRLLWMPYSISKGRWKIVQWIVIASFWVSLFGFFVLGTYEFFASEPIKGGFPNFLFFWFLPGMLGTGAFIGGGVFWSSLDDAKYAESILKVLGFKKPRSVNLSPYSEAQLGLGSSYQVYDLHRALAAYGSLKSPAD